MRRSFLTITAAFLILFTGCNPEGPKWKYSPFSKAVIQINIINKPPISYFINTENRTLIPWKYYESEPAKIEQPGKYNHSVEIDCPSIVQTNFGEETFNVLVFPGDTTYMNIEFIEGGYEITFTGDAKAINTYYLEKKLEFGVLESYQRYYFQTKSRSGLNKIKQTIDSFSNRQLFFLDNYIPIKKLSDHFIQFEKSEIIYTGINDKMNAPNRWFNLSNTDDYYNFLEKIEVDNQGAAFSSNYLQFLDEYFELMESIKFNDNLSRSDAIQYLALQRIEFSNKHLTGSNKDVYKLLNFSKIIPFHEDTEYIDSLAIALQIKNHEPLLKLVGTRDEQGYGIINLEAGKSIPEFYASDENYDMVSIRDFQDYILLLRFYSPHNDLFKISSLVLSSINNMYKENKNLKLLNICIDCETQVWLDSASNNGFNIINLIAEGNWNRKLKHTYGITDNQKYVLLSQDNLYVNKFEFIPENIQETIDSLLGNSKYHEIEIR